jgi:hypothetical protein
MVYKVTVTSLSRPFEYMAFARFCFCKNNKRSMMMIAWISTRV